MEEAAYYITIYTFIGLPLLVLIILVYRTITELNISLKEAQQSYREEVSELKHDLYVRNESIKRLREEIKMLTGDPHCFDDLDLWEDEAYWKDEDYEDL